MRDSGLAQETWVNRRVRGIHRVRRLFWQMVRPIPCTLRTLRLNLLLTAGCLGSLEDIKELGEFDGLDQVVVDSGKLRLATVGLLPPSGGGDEGYFAPPWA